MKIKDIKQIKTVRGSFQKEPLTTFKTKPPIHPAQTTTKIRTNRGLECMKRHAVGALHATPLQ